MMGIDLHELEKLAHGATPGPWKADLDILDADEGIVACICDAEVAFMATIGTDLKVGHDPQGVWSAADEERKHAAWRMARAGQEIKDAAFIAAASPDVVLALIERVRAAEAELFRIRPVFEAACREAESIDDRRRRQRLGDVRLHRILDAVEATRRGT